jgi:hypothetical protein
MADEFSNVFRPQRDKRRAIEPCTQYVETSCKYAAGGVSIHERVLYATGSNSTSKQFVSAILCRDGQIDGR